MASDDLINFDIIEGQKENIQALPSGRSAKKLAELFSPSPANKFARQTPSDTRTINDCIRAEYEAEIANIGEADDPLDVYDRYIRWTLDAYPSAQATPQSQLHTLLERATKAFVGAPQYKNDPRYIKLWLQYIQFFSDSPRESFVFLSRHGIGETLAIFYEEYAAWLESVGRWAQAEEVYKLGIEREARPTSRLLRKFGEFEERRAHVADGIEGPSSPALPTVRPALAAKIDPFAAAAAARNPQAPRQTSAIGGGQPSRPAKAKLNIFSDAGAAAPALSSKLAGSKGWDTIGSLADRKKENIMEPKPWAGETLKAGGKKSSAPKMQVFRDTVCHYSALTPHNHVLIQIGLMNSGLAHMYFQSLSTQLSQSHITIHHSQAQVTVNPVSGKKERVFVDLRVVYPTPDEPGTELSFEEVWAANRGWLGHEWTDEVDTLDQGPSTMNENSFHKADVVVSKSTTERLVVHHDVIQLDENGAPIYPKESKTKKKVIEVNETQISTSVSRFVWGLANLFAVKAKLDSPSGPKIKRKQSAEPTMTLHTQAATDDIYDIFNAPLEPAAGQNSISDDEHGYETDDYTSGAESTGTMRNISASEVGDEDEEAVDEHGEDENSDAKSVSEWSDFSTRKHVPLLNGDDGEERNDTQVSDLIEINDNDETGQMHETLEEAEDTVATPTSDDFAPPTRTSFVPIPPEDYVPSRRPYRDPVEAANNRLPFMTPITERTESSLDITDEQSGCDLLAKTPCKKEDGRMLAREDTIDLEQLSSPLREVIEDDLPKWKVAQPQLQKAKPATLGKPLGPKRLGPNALAPKGPVIKDAQCNPVDDTVRNEILASIQPPLSSYDGFYDHSNERYEKGGEIRRYAKQVAKSSRQSSTDRTLAVNTPIIVQFPGVETEYIIRRELGAGAFAPVYLVENSHPTEEDSDGDAAAQSGDENAPVAIMGRGAFASAHNRRHEREALKMEQPPTPWEFYMMRLAHSRLGPQHRATASLSPALEMHLYQDEGFLFIPYFSHGTLLDVINIFRAEPSGVMDETLAMFFTIELLRTIEALHAKQIMHGDIKADNCLLRLDGSVPYEHLSSQWSPAGTGGWAARGVTLIDFGRAIDMRAFVPDVQFIADWKTSSQDCAEMREGRPWTWQIDYHGLAGTIHCLLFGKYIETIRADAGGLATAGGRRYKIRESLKRYWQTEIWHDCFDVLLNPGQFVQNEDGSRLPVLKSMRNVRERMEMWLQGNCERGIGLRGLMGKVEAWARGKR